MVFILERSWDVPLAGPPVPRGKHIINVGTSPRRIELIHFFRTHLNELRDEPASFFQYR